MKNSVRSLLHMQNFRAPLIRLAASIIIISGSTMAVLIYWSNEFFDTTIKLHQESLRHMVRLSRNSISHIITNVHEGTMTRSEGIRRVRSLVRKMVYRDHYGINYIFMSAYDGTMLVQPFEPEKEMTNQWNLRDIYGTYIIRELVHAAKSSPEGGFVRYYYYPPGSTTPQEKIAFVIGIPELECYIGTGMYMAHVHSKHEIFKQKAGIWAAGFILLMLFPVFIFLKNILNQNKKLEEEIEDRKRTEEELRKSEERFRNISEIANDYIYYAEVGEDNSFTIEWRYGNYKELYGYTELEIEEAGGWAHIIYPDDYQKILETYNDLLKGETIVNQYRISTKDGTIKWVKNIMKPVWDRNLQQVKGFFSVVQDITDQREAHEKIIASLHEKETLLKEIHHRVKNNLQVITSLLSLQSRKIKNPEIISKFEDSQNRIRAMALVHEKLYRSENLSYIDFARYIKTLSQELFITLGGNARGITIQYSLEEVNLNIDLAIPCGLIITELVSNAIKHAFNEIKDEKKILITLERNEKIKISVKDNGSGLPDDTGIDNSKSLGLVLVPMLAKQINGEIRVLNNAGTEFILTFPDA